MNNTTPIQENEKEIALIDIFQKIWDARTFFVLALLFVWGLFWAGTIVEYIQTPPQRTFVKYIKPIFFGLEKDEYPNGTGFSANDLIAPPVLEAVFKNQNLSQYGLPPQDFYRGFSAELDRPLFPEFLENYRSSLRSSGFAPAKVEEMSALYATRLKAQTEFLLKLTWVDRANAKIPEMEILSVLSSIPAAWERYMLDVHKVAKKPIAMATNKSMTTVDPETIDYMLVRDLIASRYDIIESNLKMLEELPNGRLVLDPVTGRNTTDIRNAVRDLEKFIARPLFSPLESLGLSRDPQTLQFYLLLQVENLERSQTLLLKKAEIAANMVKTVLEVERNVDGKGGLGQGKSKNDGQFGAIQTRVETIPQLDSNFLDRLVNLTARSGSSNFRESLTKEHQDYLVKAAELGSDVERLKVRSSRVTKGKNNPLLQGLRGIDYEKKIVDGISRILVDLAGYIEATNRIYEAASNLRSAGVGVLYRDITKSEMVTPSIFGLFKTRLIYFLMLTIGLLFVLLPIAVFFDVRRLIWRPRGWSRGKIGATASTPT